MSRTLRYLRERGLTCEKVEHWNAHAGRRQDLFGFLDILVLDPKRGFVGVQVTGEDFAGHIRKILRLRSREALQWLICGGSIELIGWAKRNRDGRKDRRKVYRMRRRAITLRDFTGEEWGHESFSENP